MGRSRLSVVVKISALIGMRSWRQLVFLSLSLPVHFRWYIGYCGFYSLDTGLWSMWLRFCFADNKETLLGQGADPVTGRTQMMALVRAMVLTMLSNEDA